MAGDPLTKLKFTTKIDRIPGAGEQLLDNFIKTEKGKEKKWKKWNHDTLPDVKEIDLFNLKVKVTKGRGQTETKMKRMGSEDRCWETKLKKDTKIKRKSRLKDLGRQRKKRLIRNQP
ncbi:hypothetical protein M0813_26108 [Anaeramoeba flamelloides]|uniref:Uncharacterized protein n=1 Tax=Anaeramoeba flamelloides TaxID=1746091 RepID=A0ABQ8Y3W6_9EUKA|nr:hypothetical protein M0813_26108 [Anaeramoeba flamelloides]